MMTVNAIINITVLSIGTRIKSREKGNSSLFCFVRSVLVFEATRVPFGTWPSQIMVVAQFIVVFSFLDVVQSILIYFQWRIQPTGSRIPWGRFLAACYWSLSLLGLKR